MLTECFPRRSGTRPRETLSVLLFNIIWKSYREQLRQEQKRHTDWRRNKTVPIYKQHNYLYQKYQESYQKTSEFKKVAGYKVNTQKSIIYLYTSYEQLEIEMNKKKL